jgi:N-acyl-D-amino-acid deacylase
MEEISDLIIRNGKIIDGSGGPEILSDILIKDGKIEKIGKLDSSINAKNEIDANGFIVTPWFC